MTDRAYCVGVWGHYYGANLGDDLVTRVVVEAVRRRVPSAEVRGFSLDPADTRRRHGIQAWPITAYPNNNRNQDAAVRPGRGVMHFLRGVARRIDSLVHEVPHLVRSYRALRPVDLLVVAGSGQLLDTWSGPWGHPYTVFKWAVLARLTRTRMVFLSVGAGPIQARLARWFIRFAIDRASEVSVRDAHSADVLRDIGVTRPLPVVPDMGFGLDVGQIDQSRPELPLDPAQPYRGLVVGVNAMAHASARYWGRGDQPRHVAYLSKMVNVVRRLLDGGARVVLFSSQVRADPPTGEDLLAGLEAVGTEARGRVAYHGVDSVDELVHVISGCDYVIATRYHSVLLPLRMGIPTIGLAYHPKTVHLMDAAGQGDFCMDIDSFTEGRLFERFSELRRTNASVVQQLRLRIPPLCASVNDQFDHTLSTVGMFAGSSAVPREEPLGR